jgi:hypothetical protein
MPQPKNQRWTDLHDFLELRDVEGQDVGEYDEEALAEENLTIVGADDVFSEP